MNESSGSDINAQELRISALGTQVFVKIVFGRKVLAKKARDDLKKVSDLYPSYESQLSRFDLGSELSRINSSLGSQTQASAEIRHLARNSLKYYRESSGVFDPRIIGILEDAGYRENFSSIDFSKIDSKKIESSRIFGDLKKDLLVGDDWVKFHKRMDFTGIAKGFITDKIAEFLKKSGWNDFLVDSGGDMFASGRNQEGERWRIELEGFEKDDFFVYLSDQAVATSGISRKKWFVGDSARHHLINPQNPTHFSHELKSVTVIDKSTEKADMWAKVLFLLGKKEGLKLSEKKKMKALFLDYKGNLFYSSFTKDNI